MRLALIPLLAILATAPTLAQTPAQTPAPLPMAPADPAVPNAPAPTKTIRPPHQPGTGRKTAVERFRAANTTNDGKLTLEQAKAANMVRIVRNFDSIDLKNRGYVTMNDIRSYNKAQRAARKAARATNPS